MTLIKTLREKNGPVIIYLYFCTMGTLITLPRFALAPLLPASSVEWAMVLGIVFSSLTAQLLMNQGFFYCKGWEGGVFMSSEVVFTAFVGIALLGRSGVLALLDRRDVDFRQRRGPEPVQGQSREAGKTACNGTS